MARKFLTHLDMAGNQLLNATFEKLSTAPVTGNFEGRMYYNTSDDRIYVYSGSAWVSVGAVTDIQGTANEVNVSASTGSVTISLPDTISASVTGNAGTATKLATARTISLGGDLSGSASFDGSGDITITASVDSQSGVDSITGTANEIDVTASVGAVTVSLPSTIHTNLQGDVTGTVTKTVTGTDSAEIVRGNMADNDHFRIKIGGTGTNAGYVEIATADDGNEPIYVRQYTGVFASEARTATLLDGSGNTIFPGTVTASAGFVGNASTASALQNAQTIALGGDLSGSASFDGSASITITADIQPNSVTLGTDTTGDYVAQVTASDGISASGSGESASVTLTNTDKGSSQNIFKTISGDTGSVTAASNSASVTIAGGTGITTSASAGTVTIDNDGVLSVSGTANQISASTVSGAVTLSLPNAVTFPGTVTLNADPGNPLEAATKQYVDAAAEGLNVHPAVAVATTASVDLNSPPATIDTVTLTNGMRVLVKNQSSAAENGIYVYNSASAILERASDYNEASEIDPGDFFFVTSGSVYATTGWVQTATVTTLGTSPINFTQFSGAGTYLAGNGLTLTGNTFSINTAVTVDLNTAQTLTNKTLTSPVVSGLYLSDNNIIVEGTNDVHETTLVFTDPTQDNTITFKNATGTVAFTSDIPSNTDGLTEGSTNLYFTNERAEDAIGAILTDTATVDFTYTDNGASAGSITADVKLKSTNSYLSSASGLAVDLGALESQLVTDSFPRKAAANVGNGSATSFAVTHNFGTRDVVVNVYDNATWDTVEVDVVRTDTNNVTVSFTTAPSSNAYRVVVIG